MTQAEAGGAAIAAATAIATKRKSSLNGGIE
jgi:hypothetical protein